MPNSLQSSAIGSPASRRATNCSLSSITEHSFQGIITPSPEGESVTYVSGTMCYLCLRPLIGPTSGNTQTRLSSKFSSTLKTFSYPGCDARQEHARLRHRTYHAYGPLLGGTIRAGGAR